MTLETASTYTLDTNNRLHRPRRQGCGAGAFASREERADWNAIMSAAAQALWSWVVACGCQQGLPWAELAACKTFAFAVATDTEYAAMANPETGEVEGVPMGESTVYYPLQQSSWVACLEWREDSTGRGTISVYSNTGQCVYSRPDQSTTVLLSILRADVVSKKGVRSVGATAYHYLANKPQPKKVGVAASYAPFMRPLQVNA